MAVLRMCDRCGEELRREPDKEMLGFVGLALNEVAIPHSDEFTWPPLVDLCTACHRAMCRALTAWWMAMKKEDVA